MNALPIYAALAIAGFFLAANSDFPDWPFFVFGGATIGYLHGRFDQTPRFRGD